MKKARQPAGLLLSESILVGLYRTCREGFDLFGRHRDTSAQFATIDGLSDFHRSDVHELRFFTDAEESTHIDDHLLAR